MSIAISTELIGQSTRFTHLTTADGLSQNSVVDIMQDGYGFIWIATQDGLNRYDGSDFKTFPYYFRDVTRTNYSQLGQLFCDAYNNIWFTSLEGHLMQFNQQTEEAKIIIDSLDVSTIYFDDSSILIGTYGQGIWKLEDENIELIGLSQLNIYDIHFSKENYLVGTDNGIWINKKSQKNWVSYTSKLEGVPVSRICENNGNLYASTFGYGLFNIRNQVVNRINSLPLNLNIQDLLCDTKGNLWIATYGQGLYKLGSQTTVSRYTHKPADRFSINYNDILSIYQDQLGNVWMGTDGGGLSIWNKEINRIGGISKRQSSEKYPVDVTRAISADTHGRLWIGTSGKGLTGLSSNKDPFIHLSKESLGNNRVVSLLNLNDKLLVGTQGGGLSTLNLEDLKVTNSELPELTIWDIFHSKIRQKTILATRSKGIVIKNLKKGVWESHIPQELSGLQDQNIRTISPYTDQSIFLGSENGNIWVYNLDSDKSTQLDLQETRSGPIKSIYYQEETNTLWIGTQRAGIIAYNLVTKQQRMLDRDNGLPNNTVYAILPDENQNLWISTNKGLLAFQSSDFWENKPFKSLHQLSTKNGLFNDEFNTGASFKDEDGILYFGGIDGVNWIDPEDFSFRLNSLPVVSIIQLTSFDRDNRSSYNLSDVDQLSLSHKERNFDVQFGTINFGNDGSYQYRLEGIQDLWTDNGSNNIAHFTNIPPGNYEFQVRWMPAGYQRQEPNVASFTLQIRNPWWTTPWAKFLWLLLLGAIIAGTYKLRTNYIRREAKRKYEFEKQVGEMELQLLRTQMNPHFMFNSLNAIKNYILKSEPRLASEYLSNFAHLIRMILQNSREKTISLEEELETLLLYIDLEQLRFKDGFNFTSEIEPNIRLSSIQVPPMILQPYVENAIWHGLLHKSEDRQLSLDIRRQNGSINIDITDNGIGIEEARRLKSKSATRYKSMGMGITKSRIDITNRLNNMGIEVKIHDIGGQKSGTTGTQVQLQFPIHDHSKSQSI